MTIMAVLNFISLRVGLSDPTEATCRSKLQQDMAISESDSTHEPSRGLEWCVGEHSNVEMLIAGEGTAKSGCSKLAEPTCRLRHPKQ